MPFKMKTCTCGWKRPIITVMSLDGTMPPANLVPVYHCPQCGKGYVPDEVPEGLARAILRDLGQAPKPD